MRLKFKASSRVLKRAAAITASRSKIALAAILTLLVFWEAASAETFISRYVVSLDGVRAGGATLRTNLDASRYKVELSADVGMLLILTHLEGRASGALSGAKLAPEHFQIVMSGTDEDSIEFDFATTAEAAADGAVRLRGVVDPLSALLAASFKPSDGHPCNTVLPIFTGRDRFDLNLRPKPAGSSTAEPALVRCQAALTQPLARVTAQQDLGWEITFTKSAKSNFWLVDRVAIPSRQGLITISRTETSISAP
ncbi:MAG: DUF3108 domain-containing protein [Rhodomicrobium sp.]